MSPMAASEASTISEASGGSNIRGGGGGQSFLDDYTSEDVSRHNDGGGQGFLRDNLDNSGAGAVEEGTPGDGITNKLRNRCLMNELDDTTDEPSLQDIGIPGHRPEDELPRTETELMAQEMDLEEKEPEYDSPKQQNKVAYATAPPLELQQGFVPEPQSETQIPRRSGRLASHGNLSWENITCQVCHSFNRAPILTRFRDAHRGPPECKSHSSRRRCWRMPPKICCGFTVLSLTAVLGCNTSAAKWL
jgi:hypothetical protein